jgi:ketosteroid isomerase-like protein
MDRLEVVEQGYQAVIAGDSDALGQCFADRVTWQLMHLSKVGRTIEGRDAVVEFLLQFRDLRLEAIMSDGQYVVAAHSFTAKRKARVIATTLYEVPELQVVRVSCTDAKRG